MYLVIDGTLTVYVERTPTDIPAGGLVRVAPEVRRQIANLGPGGPCVVALGGAVTHDGRDGMAFSDWGRHGGPRRRTSRCRTTSRRASCAAPDRACGQGGGAGDARPPA